MKFRQLQQDSMGFIIVCSCKYMLAFMCAHSAVGTALLRSEVSGCASKDAHCCRCHFEVSAKKWSGLKAARDMVKNKSRHSHRLTPLSRLKHQEVSMSKLSSACCRLCFLRTSSNEVPSRSGFHHARLGEHQSVHLKGFCGTGGSITSARDSPGSCSLLQR